MYGLKSRKAGTFLHPDFLLESGFAKRLYHDYAKNLPIIDYHNHLPANEIASNKKFKNLTEIWLKGDHYKWRAMRAFGISEKYITGDASDEAKFREWAKFVPNTLRNPLFHWTQLELQNPFGVEEYLNEQSAEKIYQHCGELLQKDSFSTRGLLSHFKVEMVGTTNDPTEDLKFHQQIAKDENRFKVLPSFRPDKVLNIKNREAFLSYLNDLETSSNIKVTDINTLLDALKQRVEYFHENGCCIADHGLTHMPEKIEFSVELEKELFAYISSGGQKAFSNPEAFSGFVLTELCKMYYAKGWVQQFHLGPIRNNNKRMMQLLGPDAGFDSIGDFYQAE
ncbi:MAG TPA: glucuronate isomerase, partial [Cytophagales bacterium]|nr:glucuronate isomerase [Cytophagales bacterium]